MLKCLPGFELGYSRDQILLLLRLNCFNIYRRWCLYFLINLQPNTYPVNSLNLLKNSRDWNLIGSYNIRDQIV